MSGGARGRGATIGLALSPTRLVAAWRADDSAVAWRDVALPEPADAWRRAVQATVPALLREAGAPAVEVRVALLAPLVEVRAALLPPVTDADARRLLARSASRHFLHTPEPLRTGVAAAHRRAVADAADPRTARVIAAASVHRVQAIEEAVQAAGARLAWVAAAATLWPRAGAAARPRGTVLEVHADHVDVLAWDEQGVRDVRRGRHDALAELLAPGEPVLLLQAGAAAADTVARVEAARRAAGHPRVAAIRMDDAARAAPDDAPRRSTDAADGAPAGDAGRLAAWLGLHEARRAARDVPLALVDDDAAAPASPASAGRWVRRLALAAGLLLVAGVGYRLWLERALAVVRADRTALEATLAARGLRTGPGDVATVARAASDSLAAHTPWSVILDDVATRLPTGAWVRTLAARGDSLVLEGIADDAGRAWAALDASPRLRGVAVRGPVRRERAVDGTVSERFALRAARAPGEAAP